ncbi:MAG: AmmeMemoRadiSam system protein B [Myxococcota bacterium]
MEIEAVRPAAVAGRFYPGTAEALATQVEALLSAATPRESEPRPKAAIVPHAGFIYSGPIAASVFARIRPYKDQIRRVVLLGPAHRVACQGLVSPGARALMTPLGPVAVDLEALSLVPEVTPDPRAHAFEHSLEVQLPFIQRALPQAAVVPMLVGQVAAGEVATVLDALYGGEETLILASSDLSHYLPYFEGRRVDQETAQAILNLTPGFLDGDRACGYSGVRGLLEVAKAKRLSVRLLDLRSSGDTAGDKKEVVGYGAFGFYEPS